MNAARAEATPVAPADAASAPPWLVPLLVGLATALAIAIVWAGADGRPVMHDEWSYCLQAGQYAHGRWSVPSPALPEFFEQWYVLVTPVFASKYPPGHALLLAIGFVLHTPVLIPILLSGCTGALLFALCRRLAGVPVALLTCLLWLSVFGNLRFRASYFSEVTSGLCWLVAWWALLDWRAQGARRAMILLAIAVGWCAITRPYTAVALALPIGAVVLHQTYRVGNWRTLAAGVLVGTAVLGILPLWSGGTTGDWRTTPLATYTTQYLPFDLPGFVLREPATAVRPLPAEMERTRGFLRAIKEEQVQAPPAVTLATRLRMLGADAFGGWRLPFLVAFALGIATAFGSSAGRAGLFALATGLLLVLAYAAQAHTADWTVYYLETLPALAFVTALGARHVADRIGVRRPARVVGLLALLLLSGRDILRARDVVHGISAVTRRFRDGVEALPKRPNIVFVEYAARRNMHLALVANDGVLAEAETWIVHSRGDEDHRLMALAPARTAYRYDESTGRFTELVR